MYAVNITSNQPYLFLHRRKLLNGATPVPGPIHTTGTLTFGNRKVPGRNLAKTLSPGRNLDKNELQRPLRASDMRERYSTCNTLYTFYIDVLLPQEVGFDLVVYHLQKQY